MYGNGITVKLLPEFENPESLYGEFVHYRVVDSEILSLKRKNLLIYFRQCIVLYFFVIMAAFSFARSGSI